MKRIVLICLSLLVVLIGCEKENDSNELKEVTIEEFLNAPESSDVWYQLTGEIESIEDEEYGDFTISDETGSVYIYGMTKRKLSANDKSFSQLGLNVGDVVTLATRRTSYNGKPQGGGNPDPAYYISHKAKDSTSNDDVGDEDGDNNNDDIPPTQDELLKAKLIGKWQRTSSLYRGYYESYLSNGEGYVEEYNSDDGIMRFAFRWDIVDSCIERTRLDNGYKVTIEFEFLENGNMKQSSREYKKVSDNGTTSVDYKNPPFKSYILHAETYYYELTQAVMRCNHATGTESNSKYLQLFGNNGLLDPTGVVFCYFTPYYEGIDKYWADGKYNLTSKSTNWVYGGWYIVQGSNSYRLDGELTIKTQNQIKYIDFEFEDGYSHTRGHFEGKFN